MDILIATPCYEGKVYRQFCGALVVEQDIAVRMGHRLFPGFVNGGALITTARNQCVNGFLHSPMDRMVFVDADISWQPGDLIRLATNPRPFVAGIYRKRQEAEDYPIYILPGKHGLEHDWCYPLQGVPFGFVALSRSVFELYQEKYPDRWHKPGGGEKQPVFFQAPYADHNMWGEDIAFCFDYISAGGEIWADAKITLTHHDGPCDFTGNFWEWLKKQQKESI